jgi:hypothetical protein
MARTKAQILAIINSKLKQVSGNITATNLDLALNMALDSFLLEVDVPEAEKTSALTPIFDGVNTYVPPSDMRGDAILGIRPYVGSKNVVNTSLDRNQTAEFDRNLFFEDAEGKYAVEYNQGTKILRLNPRFDTATNYILNACDSYNGNGTWVGTDDAGNVATDTGLFTEGSGSVSFDITASAGTATLTNDPVATSVDISSAVRGKSYVFADLYLPSSTAFTSLQLRYGSSSSAYYQNSVTTQFTGSAFKQGWNLLGFNWNTATTTGSPSTSAIDYLRFQMAYLVGIGNQTGVHLDNIVLRDGDLYEIKYYTKNVILDDDGTTYKSAFNEDADTLIFNKDGEATFIEYAAGYIAPNAIAPSGQTFAQNATNLIAKYRSRYPSKRKKTVRNWYRNQIRGTSTLVF